MSNFYLAEHQEILAAHEVCHPLAIKSDGSLVTKELCNLPLFPCIVEFLRAFVTPRPWLPLAARVPWKGSPSRAVSWLACEKRWIPVLQEEFQMLWYLGAIMLRSVFIGFTWKPGFANYWNK